MDFALSEEQGLLADTIGRYLADNCPTTRVREVMESESGHDGELWGGLVELGLAGLLVPVAHGGMESAMLDLAVAAEELGYAATPGPFLAVSMAVVALAAADDQAAAGELLGGLADGSRLATVAIAEQGERWELAELEAKVEGGRLTGAKTLVPYAGVSDHILVAATGPEGPGLYLVDRRTEGVSCRALKVNDLTRRLDAVDFDRAEACRIAGPQAFERMRDAGLVLLAADAYGGSRRCLEMARDYALEREQFGQIIGAFQAVKHQLANLVAEVEPALSLYWYAAHAIDREVPDASRQAAVAKARLTDVFDRAARDSTEIHGGIGFTWEYDLQLWFRRSIFDRSFLGDAARHRERAAELAGW